TRNYYKSVLAARLAALLAWSSVQHGDRVGGLVFSEQDHFESRPRRGKAAVLHFIQQLVAHNAWLQSSERSQPASNNAEQALGRLRHVTRPGSLVVLISDFRFVEESSRVHLAQLARHNDVVLLFTHDPLEQALPPSGYYRLTDGSQELALDTANQRNRDQYSGRFQQHYASLVKMCNQLQLFLIDISTADDSLESLKNGLGLGRIKRRK
ncbi:MAG: DUF58 domain-containing protein, partial [Gammaproteobacteria bacterium]|nr:DUF58 domain-containing protein [Gammaproteobacteria bacterium]